MFLVAALDIPTREEIDDVIREAEQILSDAVLDDQFRATSTQVAPPRISLRNEMSGSSAEPDPESPATSRPTTCNPWARSPPKQTPDN